MQDGLRLAWSNAFVALAVLPVLSKSTRPSIVEWLGDYLKIILVNDVANSLLADHFRVVAVGLGNLLKHPHARQALRCRILEPTDPSGIASIVAL